MVPQLRARLAAKRAVWHAAIEATQRLDNTQAAVRRVHVGVAALVDDHEPTTTEAVGSVHQQLGEDAIVLGRQIHPRIDVEAIRIEAAGDQDQLGLEALERGDHHIDERELVRLAAAAGRQRNVERRADTMTITDVADEAATDRIVVVLVQRDRQHARVVIERVLGAVAVVDIPVHDRNALEAVVELRVARGERRVGKDAIAATKVVLSVVPWRTHERVRIVDGALKDSRDRVHRTTRCEQRDLVPTTAKRRLLAGIATRRVAQLFNARDVVAVVQTRNLIDRGQTRRHINELRRNARSVE